MTVNVLPLLDVSQESSVWNSLRITIPWRLPEARREKLVGFLLATRQSHC